MLALTTYVAQSNVAVLRILSCCSFLSKTLAHILLFHYICSVDIFLNRPDRDGTTFNRRGSSILTASVVWLVHKPLSATVFLFFSFLFGEAQHFLERKFSWQVFLWLQSRNHWQIGRFRTNDFMRHGQKLTMFMDDPEMQFVARQGMHVVLMNQWWPPIGSQLLLLLTAAGAPTSSKSIS